LATASPPTQKLTSRSSFSTSVFQWQISH
jgi:hypothetical protein